MRSAQLHLRALAGCGSPLWIPGMGGASAGTDRALQKEKWRGNRRTAFQFHRQRPAGSDAAPGVDAHAGARGGCAPARLQEAAEMVFHRPVFSLRKTAARAAARTF